MSLASPARSILLASLLAIATAAQAAAYKWVDEQGETHYSQTPPPNVPAEIMKTPSSPAAADAAAEKRRVEELQRQQEESGNTREQQKEQKAATREDAEIRAENCAKARNNLEILQSRPRVNVKDAQGLYHRLTEEERQARIEEAQKAIKEFCKD